MPHSHKAFEENCFACKVKTLQFGTVPGAYRATNSTSYYDKDALPDWPSKEEVMDHREDIRRAPIKEETFFVPDPETT
jgi:hypothetical protein